MSVFEKDLLGKEGDLYVLVTGANSGLGLAICRRLIDTFLKSHPSTSTLTLLFTTRSSKKADATSSILRSDIPASQSCRIVLRPENVNLSCLLSIDALVEKLNSTLPRLDVVILNAGNAGFTGIDWPGAVYQVLTDFRTALTWPLFKLSSVGYLTARQLPPAIDGTVPSEPPLGEVFCSNLFGHYVLVHGLMPVLSLHQNDTEGRVIWISSIEATERYFDRNDLQALRSERAYEHVKRLTDILAMSASLPSTSTYVDDFLALPSPEDSKPTWRTKPTIYLAHPGICATSIMPLLPVLQWLMILAFYIVRIVFRSPWHTISTYKGACAPVFLALAPKSSIERVQQATGGGAAAKWGSYTDRWGREGVCRTEVDGWGFGFDDVAAEQLQLQQQHVAALRSGRRRGAEPATDQSRAAFEATARVCWAGMEHLRDEWRRNMQQWQTQMNYN